MSFLFNAGNNEVQWCFSQVKGALDDDVTEGRVQQTKTSFHFMNLEQLNMCGI
jgi:hypothetical protein